MMGKRDFLCVETVNKVLRGRDCLFTSCFHGKLVVTILTVGSRSVSSLEDCLQRTDSNKLLGRPCLVSENCCAF